MGKRKGRGVLLPFSLPLDPPRENRRPTILDKSPWDSTAIFIFLCHFSVPSYNGAAFWKISCSSPSPYPIQPWNSKKILDTRVQHCLWDEGRCWTCVNWKTPQKCKSVPRLLSMIVALGTRRTTNNKPSQSVIVFFCSTNHQFLSPLHKFCCKSFTPSSQLFGNIRWLQK